MRLRVLPSPARSMRCKARPHLEASISRVPGRRALRAFALGEHGPGTHENFKSIAFFAILMRNGPQKSALALRAFPTDAREPGTYEICGK